MNILTHTYTSNRRDLQFQPYKKPIGFKSADENFFTQKTYKMMLATNSKFDS